MVNTKKCYPTPFSGVGFSATKAIRNAGFRRLATIRPASGFGTGDTDAAPQSLTAHGVDC